MNYGAVLSCIGIDIGDSLPPQSIVELKSQVRSKCPNLLGDDKLNSLKYIEVCQWLSFAVSIKGPDDLALLDSSLRTKSYLVGNRHSLADVTLYVILHSMDFKSYPFICRWFDHIQHICGKTSGLPLYSLSKFPTIFPIQVVTSAAVVTTAPTAAVPSSAEKDEKKGDAKKASEAAAINKEPEGEKKEKAPKSKAATSNSTAAAPAAASASATTDADDLDPSKLDIRVGLVVKCWDHPESEKLLCEEIDLGEGSTRLIASGLRAFYKSSDLQGRHVMVLSNLKERAIANFKSNVQLNPMYHHHKKIK